MRDFQDTPDLVKGDISQARELPEMVQQVQSSAIASIPVRGSLLGKQQGTVQGFWEIHHDELRPSRISLLPEGARLSVPAGSSIAVIVPCGQGRKERWCAFDFPHPGTLNGPLLWGETDRPPRSNRYLVLQRTAERRDVAANWLTTGVMLMLLALWLQGWRGVWWLTPDAGGMTPATFFAGLAWLVVAIITLCHTGHIKRMIKRVLVRREKRTIDDFPSPASRVCTVTVPKQVQHLVDHLSTAARVRPEGAPIDALDGEIARSLGSYKDTYCKVEQQAGLAGGTKALLRHTRKMVDEISENILAVPHLMANDDLRKEFVELVGRAEMDLQKAIQAKEVEEVDSVKSDIEALSAQIEKHGVAV